MLCSLTTHPCCDVEQHARRGTNHCTVVRPTGAATCPGQCYEWGWTPFMFGRCVVTGWNLRPIGVVQSSLKDLAAAPRQSDEGAPEAWLVFQPDVIEGLGSVAPGDRMVLMTWLHLARRDMLRVHPRGDPSRPEEGVFSTRSPHPRRRSASVERTRSSNSGARGPNFRCSSRNNI